MFHDEVVPYFSGTMMFVKHPHNKSTPIPLPTRQHTLTPSPRRSAFGKAPPTTKSAPCRTTILPIRMRTPPTPTRTRTIRRHLRIPHSNSHRPCTLRLLPLGHRLPIPPITTTVHHYPVMRPALLLLQQPPHLHQHHQHRLPTQQHPPPHHHLHHTTPRRVLPHSRQRHGSFKRHTHPPVVLPLHHHHILPHLRRLLTIPIIIKASIINNNNHNLHNLHIIIISRIIITIIINNNTNSISMRRRLCRCRRRRSRLERRRGAILYGERLEMHSSVRTGTHRGILTCKSFTMLSTRLSVRWFRTRRRCNTLPRLIQTETVVSEWTNSWPSTWTKLRDGGSKAFFISPLARALSLFQDRKCRKNQKMKMRL